MSLMSIKRFTRLAVLATLSLATTGKAALADCNCIDDLAHQLVSQMDQLEREYVANFRGAREYQHGLIDLREMNALAAHLHDTAHRNDSREHLRLDAERLDLAFHHFETVVADMERGRHFERGDRFERGERFERGDHFGRRGWDLRGFRSLMSSVEATIHRLQDMAVHGCGCAVQTGYTPQIGCETPTGFTQPTTWAPAVNTGNWNSPSTGWYGTSGAMTPAVTPSLPMRPGYSVPGYTVPSYTVPALPTYSVPGRETVPQRSGTLGGGLFFRL